MNLTALVLTMCVHTSLDCEKVDVAYADLADSQLGRVTAYSNGYKTIEVANYLKNKHPYRTRNVIMQQLTYLAAWEDYPGHFINANRLAYKSTCSKIAWGIKVNTINCWTTE